MRARYGLTPRRVGELDGSRHTSGAKAVRGTHRRLAALSGWGSDEGRRRLRCSAGARQLRWQRSGQRGTRWSPSFRRGRAKTARARTVAPLPLHSGCTWTYRSTSGADRYAAYGPVVRSRPEERNNVARSSEGQAFTTGMNAWPSLSGACAGPAWRPAVLHRRKRRRLLSTVAWTAIAAVLSTPCDAGFSRFRDRSDLPIA